jgi:hypothetical protein
MYITYHVNVPRDTKKVKTSIPHNVLNSVIQSFIIDRGIKQELYFIDCNGYYTFLYLDNGDRIDISN